MAAILGIFESSGRQLRESDADGCLRAMSGRGDRTRVLRTDRVLLGVSHFEWEDELATGGAERLARVGEISVAADASLFYTDDLRRDLRARGVDASSASAGQLIAAAYRAWGDDCVHHLEGDFAFVLYDGERQRALYARDFSGRRGLYFAQLEGRLVVASSIAGVLAHPGCARDLDLAYIGSAAASLLAEDLDTPYRAVKSLRAGARVACRLGQEIQIEVYWQFPTLNEQASSTPEDFGHAAEELRELLARAVLERLAPDGPTALCLSGGYDSPALFGAGMMRLGEMGESQRLRAVSMSYPPGDPAREDEFIADIAGRWSAPVHWVHIENVPLVDRLADYAARADEPFLHSFEEFIRSLFAGARDVGARVALLGDGGDQLFAVSTIFMLDLFAQLRWKELAREWQAFGPQGYRAFFTRIIAPVARSAVHFGRPDRSLLMREPPPWIRHDFLHAHGLLDREFERVLSVEPPGRSRASTEMQRAIRHPVMARVQAGWTSFALEAGLEVRAPLLDQRILNFAARRPRGERASKGEVKLLLRRSMRGLLPDHVLTPRKEKTGVLLSYFDRSLRADRTGVIENAFRNPCLAELGILDPARLREEWHKYRSKGGSRIGMQLFYTLQMELWTRARMTPGGTSPTV